MNLEMIYNDSKFLIYIPEEYKKNQKALNTFVQGFFEKYGEIIFRNNFNTSVECYMRTSSHKNVIDVIEKLYSIKSSEFDKNIGFISFTNVNAMDFLYELYKNSDARYRDEDMYKKYQNLMTIKEERIPFCKFIKTDERGITPLKSRASDIGYDLTIVEKVKDMSAKTAIYDTFIKVQPCYGYYTKIVPRSSLYKSGYILVNSIGIIDPSYTATLKIVLTKIDESLPDLKLPFKCCQLILDRANHYKMEEVIATDFIDTERVGGGFGSTDKK